MAKGKRNTKATAAVLFVFAAGMVGVAYAAVPLYRLFCQVTGFAGTTQVAEQAPQTVSERMITVRFDANVSQALAWSFKPERHQVRVALGKPTLAFYKAINLADSPITGTATYNVTPYKVAPYFSKIECFCFTEQTLAAGEEVSMPVDFFVDPAILDDPDTRDVKEITLSYTFFEVEGAAADVKPQAKAPAPAERKRPDKG